jgi:hypothetical protein
MIFTLKPDATRMQPATPLDPAPRLPALPTPAQAVPNAPLPVLHSMQGGASLPSTAHLTPVRLP